MSVETMHAELLEILHRIEHMVEMLGAKSVPPRCKVCGYDHLSWRKTCLPADLEK